jgi:hypothetical protein
LRGWLELGQQFDGCGWVDEYETLGQTMVQNAIKVPFNIVFLSVLAEPVYPDYWGQVSVLTSIEYGVHHLRKGLNVDARV